MLTVEKIGGTSMSALKEVIKNIVFYGDRLCNRVLLVSSFSGVTDLLLENKKTREPGVYQQLASGADFRDGLRQVAAHLKDLNRQYAYLGLDVADTNDVVEVELAQALVYL